ncbi:MAG TPA: acetyl-CoA hydrolase/transferase C-terminal domain-containing protein [Cyclobacteriaceae bacterium]|nr:acetyl-CoA hydrolase/transferase C-terminal domain-containing protein [Cyclobacteriaceae bacterium]HRJ80255.1 acetyl-CoA hydrolase/transferase C-terminal domain-containing protein [Cyclobacteriaceae bacterium]
MYPKIVSAREAVKIIQSGNRVFVHGSAATPQFLLRALAKRAHELKNVELVAVSTLGELELAKPEYAESFYINSLFVSENIRSAINDGRGNYIPIFLSEISRLFEKNILPLDVALLHISPPDKHGLCSLGVSVDVARAAAKHAKHIIAQVNPNMPRTHGDGFIDIHQIHTLVETDDNLPEVNYAAQITDCDRTIGKYVAELVEDRSTLQMGIGAIPDAVLESLTHCKDLGVHTEMFSNGVIDLMKKGVITNKYKKKHRGKTVTSFAIGSRDLYSFIDDNPQFAFLEAEYVNDGRIIRTNPKVVAINSAIEIDITGQVCADSIGTYQYSGVGGQMDFIRGASLSEGGKPIIAMGSATKKGASKIVPFLKQGAGVVTTRAHMHYVVTEYGVAYLYGKNLRQRAYELMRIAHPDNREALEQEIIKRFGSNVYAVQ